MCFRYVRLVRVQRAKNGSGLHNGPNASLLHDLPLKPVVSVQFMSMRVKDQNYTFFAVPEPKPEIPMLTLSVPTHLLPHTLL